MFWVGITGLVVAIFLLTWVGARYAEPRRPRKDPEDAPVLPLFDDDP